MGWIRNSRLPRHPLPERIKKQIKEWLIAYKWIFSPFLFFLNNISNSHVWWWPQCLKMYEFTLWYLIVINRVLMHCHFSGLIHALHILFNAASYNSYTCMKEKMAKKKNSHQMFRLYPRLIIKTLVTTAIFITMTMRHLY